MNEVYFKEIEYQIIESIKKAVKEIKIAIAWFTNEKIFDTIISSLDKGINIELITINDYINNRDTGLDFDHFIKKSGKLYFSSVSNLMHHKFLIIDQIEIITGSYNWTYNAEYRNSENIVRISDNYEITDSYLKEFENLKSSSSQQINRISVQPEPPKMISFQNFLSKDFEEKILQEKKNGLIFKALESTQKAMKTLPDNEKFTSLKQELHKLKSRDNGKFYKFRQFRSGDIVNLYPESENSKLASIHYFRYFPDHVRFYLNREGYLGLIGIPFNGDNIRLLTPRYIYHIEDGQFSRDIELNYIAGKEKDIVTIPDQGYEIQIYILHISDSYYVECIGDIERTFPESDEEHELLKKQVINYHEDN